LDLEGSVLGIPLPFQAVFRTFNSQIKKYPENMDFVEKEKYPGFYLGSGCEIVLPTRRRNPLGNFEMRCFIMAKTTIKELEARINGMEERMNSIDDNIKLILEAINGSTPTPKSSPKKTEGKVKNSKKATTIKVDVVDGQGKGQGKKFINVVFDGRPSDKTLEVLKTNGFKYFAPTKVWSTLHTDKKLAVAQSLIK
jgi:hypothetical protein